MKHRSVMAVIFLSIFTLGIYDLFWLVKIKKELNAKTNVHTPSMWLLIAPVLVLVAGFIVALVTAGGGSTSSEHTATAVNVITILVYLIAVTAIVPITFYWFFKFSKAVSQYTNKEVSTAMTFILLWILRFIGIAVLQDHFNDMLKAGATPSAAGGMMPPSAPTTPAVMPQQHQEQPPESQQPNQQPPAAPMV